MSNDHYLSPQKIKIKRRDGALMLKMDGQCLDLAPPRRAVPLTAPDEFIVLSALDGGEIGIVRRLADLEPDSRALLADELHQIYRRIQILRVIVIKREPMSNMIRWTVEIEDDGQERDAPVLAEGVKPSVGVRLMKRARSKTAESEANLPGVLTSGREVTFEIAGTEDVQNARYPRIFITDTQGLRYEIPNCEELDLTSRRLGEKYF